MFIIDSYMVAVLFCLVTMLGWGSWANTLKLSSKEWEFPLYYWDYSLGLVGTALLLGLTMGSTGDEGRSFLVDLQQADSTAITAAVISGVIFNLSNLLIVAATAIAGMSVAFPIAVGLALVIGVIVNYLGDPLGNPYFLFTGLFLVVLAILFNAKAYGNLPSEGTTSKGKGILLAVLSGILMGFFYRFIASSMITDFRFPEDGFLTSYSAMFIFTLGILLSNFIFNVYFMYHPVTGKRVGFYDYRRLGTPRLHAIGILGGMVWCVAMEFNLIASEKAGFAISYGLGQGATMISAVWGVFVWKEFVGAKKGTSRWLAAMFGCFTIGLILIVMARFN